MLLRSIRLLGISALYFIFFCSSTQAQTNIFDASTYSQQNDLLFALTNGLTSPVDPNIDTLLFMNNVDAKFRLQRDVTPGAVAPGTLTAFGENRAYQHLVFENSSTANKWVLNAINLTGNGIDVEAILTTKSLTLNDTTLAFEATTTGAPVPTFNYVDQFILDGTNAGGTAFLTMNNAHIDTSASPTKIEFASDALIDVSGTDNLFYTPGGGVSRSIMKLQLRVNPNSNLNLVDGTQIKADFGGFLTLGQGSTLDIADSELFLTRFDTDTSLQSIISGATINISGIFNNDPASLYLTDPQITNSSIVLGNNNRMFSTQRVGAAGYSVGDFFFSGDNTINMAAGSQLLGRSSQSDEDFAFFEFANGKTFINGTSGATAFMPKVRAVEIKLDNATLEYSNVDIDDDLQFLNLRNNSTLKTLAEGSNFDHLKTLNVENSTLSGEHFYSQSALLKANLTDATLRIDKASRTSSTSFFLSGVDGLGPDSKATVTFAGDNTVVSRIDPAGKDIGIDQGIVTGVNSYSDSVYFTRQTPFTDETSSVVGLANVTSQLEAFAPGLTAQEYATGGANSDGIYDVFYFNNSNMATTAATADSDMVAVRLGSSMPALLTATQVATPSADNRVSYKLSVTPQAWVAPSIQGIVAGHTRELVGTLWHRRTAAFSTGRQCDPYAGGHCGTWLRMSGGSYEANGLISSSAFKDRSSYDSDLAFIQGGMATSLWNGGESRFIGSLFGHYTDGDATIFDGIGSAQGRIASEGGGIGGSLTWLVSNGFYADLVSLASWYDIDTTTIQSSDSTDGTTIAESLEIGYSFRRNCALNIIPQMQVVYQNTSVDDYIDSRGISNEFKDAHNVEGRFGIHVERTSSMSKMMNGLMLARLGVDVLHDFTNDSDALVNRTPLGFAAEGTELMVGGGIAVLPCSSSLRFGLQGDYRTELDNEGREGFNIEGTVGFGF